MSPGRSRWFLPVYSSYHEGRSLAAHGAVSIDELPHDAVLDEEAPTGLGDAQSRIAGGEPAAGDGVEQFLTLGAVDRLGREARRKVRDLVQVIFEAGLRRLVRVDEAGIRIGVVGEHAMGRLLVEPCGRGMFGVLEKRGLGTNGAPVARHEQ